MSSPDHPSARDRAAEAAHYLLACDNVRAAAAEYLFAVTGLVELDQVDEVVDALLAAPNLLAALAGVPHPPPGTFSYDDPRAGRDHMAIYRDFWRDLVETDGRLDLNKVARELADFSFVMDQVPLVYDHVTGGRMTKPMYFARDVISEADERCERTAEEVVAEARAEWEAEAGVPHPGVEELAEVIDPPAFDPRRLDVGTAYERGRRQRAALDAAGRVRALLGHTTTDTQES